MSDRDVTILRSLVDRIDPTDAGAFNNLGVVYFQKGLVRDAVAAFERALELDPRLDVARHNAELAFRESGHFEARVAELERAVETDPADAEARDALARVYLLGGDPDGAAQSWEALLGQRPGNTTLHMKLAFAEAERGRLEQALHLLEDAAELAPDDAAIRLQMAEILFQSGLPFRAETEVRRALDMDASRARGWALLAELLETTDRTEEAQAARDRARDLDPHVLETEGHLSLERFRSANRARVRYAPPPGEGGPDQPGSESARAIPEHPAAVDAELGGVARAAELRREGRLDDAAAELERAMRAGEDSREARQALAELHLLRGELEPAAQAYAALVTDQEDSPRIWNEWGVALHRLRRLDEAVQAYRRAVALDPGYNLGWNNLAVALAQRGDPGAAERAFRKAAQGDAPPELLWNLGLFLSLNDRADDAVEVYRAAVSADPAVAESWNRLGSALFQARRSEAARDALMQALERDPALAEARYQLGFALSALGDFRGALRETKRALDQVPILPTPRYQLLVDARFEDGTMPAPETLVEERVESGSPVVDFEFDPAALDAAFAAFRLPEAAAYVDESQFEREMEAARVSLRRGQLRRAADEVARVVARAPRALGPRLLEGEILLRQGLAGEALERFEAVIDASVQPRDQRAARVGGARALLELGRLTEAVAMAEEAEKLGGPTGLRARALLAAGRAEEAIPVFERAVARGETQAATLIGHGNALLEAGRPAAAETVFRRALAAHEGAGARVGLARALTARGDRAGAMSSYRRAVETLPSYAPAVLGLAELQWWVGSRQAAVRSLVDFLVLDPRHVGALLQLGSWLEALDRPGQAARSFQRVLRLDPGNQAARRELDRIRQAGGG